MVFDASARMAEMEKKEPGKFDPFPFLWDGEEYEIPTAARLTGRQVDALNQGNNDVLMEYAPEAYAVMLDMPLAVVVEITDAWLRAGGMMTQGKGPAPSRSSHTKKSPKPRKRT